MATSFPAPLLASSLLALSTTNDRKPVLSTSCPAIDDVLKGGFPYGLVTSISGSVSSTKILIAMHTFASHLLADPTTEATWVDTTGSFPSGSLKDIICSKLQQQQRNDVNQVLQRAKVARAFDLLGLAETIEEISLDHERGQKAAEGVKDSRGEGDDEEESTPYTEGKRGVRLIVVDNISHPYASMVNKGQIQGQATLVAIQRSLVLLSRGLNIAVLLLNDIPPNATVFRSKYSSEHYAFQSRFESVSWRLANGPTYAYGVDLHILLSTHRHEPEEGATWLSGGPKNASREDTVFEVLVDRMGDKSRRWGVFSVVGAEFREVTI